MELKKITQEELNKKLDLHKEWLFSNCTQGERLDLSYTDIRDVNLYNALLEEVNLEGVHKTIIHCFMHCNAQKREVLSDLKNVKMIE